MAECYERTTDLENVLNESGLDYSFSTKAAEGDTNEQEFRPVQKDLGNKISRKKSNKKVGLKGLENIAREKKPLSQRQKLQAKEAVEGECMQPTRKGPIVPDVQEHAMRNVDSHMLTELIASNEVSNIANEGQGNESIPKAAEKIKNDRLQEMLHTLGLSDFLTFKLSLQKVLELYDGDKELRLTWAVLGRLLMRNRNGRDHEVFQYNEKQRVYTTKPVLRGLKISKVQDSGANISNEINSLDVFVAIWHCCDPMLRQALCQKLFLSQLACPLILPDQAAPTINVFLWPLRKIAVNVENDLVSLPSANIDLVAFLRLGGTFLSKSVFLNKVVDIEDAFFHRDAKTGHLQKIISKGMIENFIYQSKYSDIDGLKKTTALWNLRGDGIELKEQVDIISQLSDMVVVFIEPTQLSDDTVVQRLETLSKKQLVLFIQNRLLPDRQLENLMNDLNGKTKGQLKDVIPIFLSENGTEKNIQLLVRELVATINENSTDSPLSFEERLQNTAQSHIQLHIDEHEKDFKTAYEPARHILQRIGSKHVQQCKMEVLPLQGEKWKQWSKQKGLSSGSKLDFKQKVDIERKMKDIEKAMQEMNPSDVFIFYAECLCQIDNTKIRNNFLQYMKILLDEKSTRDLKNVRKDWLEAKSNYDNVKRNLSNDSECKAEDKIELEKLDVEVKKAEQLYTDASFGLEHFFRELAVFYKFHKNNETYKVIARKLPEIAAALLLQGFPLEIMDGDAINIVVEWVQSVLHSLEKIIGSAKIFVLSVLGIQSSGKSTLLNTMFGINFAVSAGRCTKGLFIQLIPVDKTRCDVPFDYLVVLDTEGLRSQEIRNTVHNHDNMLATLVIGMADATIINIKGEGQSDMTDILEIVIHAFLKIQVAYTKLRNRKLCMFAHQNVSAQDADSQLLQAHSKAIDILNRMTKAAAKKEGIDGIELFSQVIDFKGKVNYDRWYFSDCWKGDPPMAPFNPAYSDKAYEMKQCIIKDISKSQTAARTLEQFCSSLNDLWEGVLSLDFVFSFKNSEELEANRNLQQHYSALMIDIEEEVSNSISVKVINIQGCGKAVDLDTVKNQCLSKFKQEIDHQIGKAKTKLNAFIDEHTLMEQWRSHKEIQLQMKGESLTNEAENTLTVAKDRRKAQLFNKEHSQEHRQNITKAAIKLAESCMSRSLSEYELKKEFEILWQEGVHRLPEEKKDDVNVLQRFLEGLRTMFADDINLLQQTWREQGSSTMSDGRAVRLQIQKDMLKNEHIAEKKSLGKAIRDTLLFWRHFDVSKCADSIMVNVNMQLAYMESIIDEDTRVPKSFMRTHVRKTFSQLQERYDKIDADEKVLPVKLTKAFQIKIFVMVCNYAAVKYQAMHQLYEKENGVQATITAARMEIWNMFKNRANKAVKEKVATDLLCDKLQPLIIAAIGNKVQETLKLRTIRHFDRDKFKFIVLILTDLFNKKNFVSYIRYLSDPQGFSMGWLKEWFTENQMPDYEMHAADFVQTLMTTVKDNFREACKVHKSLTFEMTESFCNSIKDHIPLPSNELTGLVDLGIENIRDLESMVINRLTKDEVVVKDSVMNRKGGWNDTPPYDAAFKTLWGCSAKCPFCFEPCSNTEQEHYEVEISGHSCIQHKPQGLRGTYYEPTGALVPRPCCFDINGDLSVKLPSYTEYRPYKEYKKSHPDWHISPSTKIDSCKYWMKVMYDYKDEFVKYYQGKNDEDIPEAWKDITTEEALESLSTYILK